jgi:type IV pilus biogenesis/stability protein PilW
MMCNLIRLTVGLLLLVSCATEPKNQTRDANLHLQIGTGYLDEGQYPQALSELLIAEKLDPKNELVQNNLGLVYFLRQKYVLAEKHLSNAILLKPNYTDALNNLARVHIEMGEYNKAISELDKVIRDLTYTYPDKAWVNLGMAYFRKGDFEDSKKKLAEALKINRKNCLAYDLFGRSQYELHEYKSATDSLDMAITLCKDSGFDEPNYYSGLAYQKLGNLAKALARMEEVTRLYPDGRYTKKAQEMLNMMTK